MTLYVPEGCVEEYSNAEGWSLFRNIKTFDTAQVLIIPDNTEYNVVPVSYYNLSGEKLDYPHSGLNIVKYSDGQIRKVLITE